MTDDHANQTPDEFSLPDSHGAAAANTESRAASAAPPAQEQTRRPQATLSKPPPRVANPPRRELAPGVVLADRYLIERKVGSGGTGVVYQARDMTSSTGVGRNLRVAIKAPRADADQSRAAARLRHEFEHARRLAHPNVVRVLELYDQERACFMTMELLEGRLLSELIRDWTMLPPPLAYKILHGCARALAHAHSREVVHGDFKPGNVFVTTDEEIKVVDFGAAAALSGKSDSRIAAGTPAYASPQVLSGEKPDRRDDIFSFACVTYELLTGQHPFERRSSLEARDLGKIPPRAWNLSAAQWLALLSALSWDRAERPEDIQTLLTGLASESRHVPQSAPIKPEPRAVVTELPEELVPPQRSWGFFVFIACALVVTFIATQRHGTVPGVAETPAAPSQTATVPPTSNPAAAATGKPEMRVEPSSRPQAPTQVEHKASESSAAAAQSATTAPAAAAKPAQPAAAQSDISFESRSIITSEGSVAAVFLIKRSQPLRGRARVQWNAVSGSADAGIDFASDARGSVEFADGQAQRAIYVPLRNDLTKEDDETFTVRLHSPAQARLGAVARAEATIRDDD